MTTAPSGAPARHATPWHLRDRVRELPGGDVLVKGGVFVVGLALIALGGILVVLPGPLTIPPIVLGLYVWSLEFAFAEKLFLRAQKAALKAWDAAKVHPWRTGVVTVGGLVLAGVAFWAVHHYDLVQRLHDQI